MGIYIFFFKYLVCGFKIEISEYPAKVLYVTYSPYKYEVNRTKTHEMRAKYFSSFFSGEVGACAGVAGLETGGPQKMCHHDDHKNTPPIHGRSILIYVTFWIH